MARNFFEQPIINSPYEFPSMHWELDSDGQPTNKIIDRRRRAEFVTPVPKAKGRKSKKSATVEIEFGDQTGVLTKSPKNDPTPIINDLRVQVNSWRNLKNPRDWQVTPETRIHLLYWQYHNFSQTRLFLCQLVVVETLIWLTKIAFKFATGVGKTTVMVIMIILGTINVVRYPNTKINCNDIQNKFCI